MFLEESSTETRYVTRYYCRSREKQASEEAKSLNIIWHRHHHTTAHRHGHGIVHMPMRKQLVLREPTMFVLPSTQRTLVKCG